MNARSETVSREDPGLRRLLDILNTTIDAGLPRASASTTLSELLEGRGLSVDTVSFAIEAAWELDEVDAALLVPSYDLGTVAWRMGETQGPGLGTDF